MIEHERLDEIVEKRAEIDAREATLRASARALLDPHEAVMTEWKEAVATALDLGAGPPARPDLPDTQEIDEEIRSLGFRREKVKVAERRIHAQIRDEVEAECSATVAEALEEARPALAVLEATLGKVVESWRDAKVVRNAVDLVDPNNAQRATGLRARSRPQPTMLDLLDVLMNGGDLLGIAAPGPIPDTVPQVDRQPDLRVGGGKITGLGTPPEWPKPKHERDRFA